MGIVKGKKKKRTHQQQRRRGKRHQGLSKKGRSSVLGRVWWMILGGEGEKKNYKHVNTFRLTNQTQIYILNECSASFFLAFPFYSQRQYSSLLNSAIFCEHANKYTSKTHTHTHTHTHTKHAHTHFLPFLLPLFSSQKHTPKHTNMIIAYVSANKHSEPLTSVRCTHTHTHTHTYMHVRASVAEETKVSFHLHRQQKHHHRQQFNFILHLLSSAVLLYGVR